MGLFEGLLGGLLPAFQKQIGGSPLASGLLGGAGPALAAGQGGEDGKGGGGLLKNPMALASILGMVGGAIGGPNSWQGRLGAGVSQVANGQMSADALLKREEGNRKFLSDLLKAHGQNGLETATAFGSMTPGQTGGISGSMGGY